MATATTNIGAARNFARSALLDTHAWEIAANPCFATRGNTLCLGPLAARCVRRGLIVQLRAHPLAPSACQAPTTPALAVHLWTVACNVLRARTIPMRAALPALPAQAAARGRLIPTLAAALAAPVRAAGKARFQLEVRQSAHCAPQARPRRQRAPPPARLVQQTRMPPSQGVRRSARPAPPAQSAARAQASALLCPLPPHLPPHPPRSRPPFLPRTLKRRPPLPPSRPPPQHRRPLLSCSLPAVAAVLLLRAPHHLCPLALASALARQWLWCLP